MITADTIIAILNEEFGIAAGLRHDFDFMELDPEDVAEITTAIEDRLGWEALDGFDFANVPLTVGNMAQHIAFEERRRVLH